MHACSIQCSWSQEIDHRERRHELRLLTFKLVLSCCKLLSAPSFSPIGKKSIFYFFTHRKHFFILICILSLTPFLQHSGHSKTKKTITYFVLLIFFGYVPCFSDTNIYTKLLWLQIKRHHLRKTSPYPLLHCTHWINCRIESML